MDRSTALAVVPRIEHTEWCLEVQGRNVKIYILSPFHQKGKNTVKIYQEPIYRLTLNPHILGLPISPLRPHAEEEETARGTSPSEEQMAEPRFTPSKWIRGLKSTHKETRLKFTPVMRRRWQRYTSAPRISVSLIRR